VWENCAQKLESTPLGATGIVDRHNKARRGSSRFNINIEKLQGGRHKKPSSSATRNTGVVRTIREKDPGYTERGLGSRGGLLIVRGVENWGGEEKKKRQKTERIVYEGPISDQTNGKGD